MRGVQHDPRRRAVAVPGDHARALAGVGRRHLFPDESVEQRRLARLHLARDRHPQRLVEPAQLVVQPPCRLGLVAVRIDREQQHPAGGVGERGHRTPSLRSVGADPGRCDTDSLASSLILPAPQPRRLPVPSSPRAGEQRPRLLANQLQLLQLLGDLGQPGLPLGARGLHRALRGLLSLQQGALELVGLRGEVVAQVALPGAQPVPGVLGDLERDVVDVAARRGLRLVLPAGDLLLALVADRLAAHEDRGTDADRVDRRREAQERCRAFRTSPCSSSRHAARSVPSPPNPSRPRWVRPSGAPTGSRPTGRRAARAAAGPGRRRSGPRRAGPARAPAASPR